MGNRRRQRRKAIGVYMENGLTRQEAESLYDSRQASKKLEKLLGRIGGLDRKLHQPRPKTPAVRHRGPQSRSRAGKGFVYVVSGEGGLLKIGWSSNPERRLKELQVASPHSLKFLKTWPGSMEEEKALHRLLMDHRVHGEWFSRSPLLDRILGLYKGG